jgi:preprotein translocase subunit SecA
MTDEDLDRLQVSIDRARAAAQRTFHRSLKELRRLQTEHLEPAALMIQQAMAADALIMKEFEDRKRQFEAENAQGARAVQNSAKQTQSQPEKTASIPRSAPCPCKSGEKYKRCCGKNAPPVLSTQAA